ncbi:MAG: DsrE/DsrF/TusD sulfur relay family protein [Gammaproteobacteria bacterium]|nr:MAG: DsrE/DsrF/TusD sulfur relay family protein [Gammaproteobacteria bacterium]
MKILFIVNDPPYGTERCFNAMRLALALLKDDEKPQISVFLLADAVLCAKSGQQTPDGYYSLERMLQGVLRHAEVALCGTCMDARGIRDSELISGATRGTMPQLASLTLAADKVLVF